MSALSRASSVQGLSLVIVVGWALFAVVMLTGTTVAANQIDRRVDRIVNEVTAIDRDLDAVATTQSVNERASAILAAATPLTGELDDVITATAGIDDSAASIEDTVGSIRATAGGINERVGRILANFVELDPVVSSIADGIEGINVRADRVIDLAGRILGDTSNVLSAVGDVDGHANSIDCAVHGQSCQTR